MSQRHDDTTLCLVGMLERRALGALEKKSLGLNDYPLGKRNGWSCLVSFQQSNNRERALSCFSNTLSIKKSDNVKKLNHISCLVVMLERPGPGALERKSLGLNDESLGKRNGWSCLVSFQQSNNRERALSCFSIKKSDNVKKLNHISVLLECWNDRVLEPWKESPWV